MKKDAIEAIQSGLKGAFIHSNPLDIIEGLSPEFRQSKKGPFMGCNRYPKCKLALWDKPVNRTCPEVHDAPNPRKRPGHVGGCGQAGPPQEYERCSHSSLDPRLYHE